jgi:hypothetical protein
MAIYVRDGLGANKIYPIYSGKTYSASLVNFTPAATTITEVLVMAGAAGVYGRLKYMSVSGMATALGRGVFTLKRWSTAGTLSTAVLTAVPTQCKHDSTAAAPSVTVSSVGTAAYGTPGTTNAIIRQAQIVIPSLTEVAGGIAPIVEWRFGADGTQPPMIQSATELFVLYATGESGSVYDVNVTWEEDTF